MSLAHSFNNYEKSHSELLRSKTLDLGTHIMVISSTNLSSAAKATISINHPTPVLFKYKGVEEWWTNGACHNPYGPAVITHGKGEEKIFYKDENGYPHNTKGPAEIIKKTRDKIEYEELWKITPGILHRENAPAVTIITHDDDIKNRTSSLKEIIHKAKMDKFFSDEKGIRSIAVRTQEWYLNGIKRRSDEKLPSEITEHGVLEVTQVSPTYSFRTLRVIGSKEFSWTNEYGNTSRTNGGASVILFGVLEDIRGGKLFSRKYMNWTQHWYYDGNSFSKSHVNSWIQKSNISPNEGAPIDHPYFTEEDEFCFTTDVISKIGEN